MTSPHPTTHAALDVALEHRFADELPELALAWQAEDAPDAELLVLSEDVAADLGLDVEALRSPAGLGLLTGTLLPPAARPVAQGYAGHQFGGYSPRLGDGRALLLGELRGADGRLRDLHLKGSGRTPFSRGGDGRAVVGPMLREHLISEAMHVLGVPTTRSLAVVATGRSVQREVPLPGALLARVASSHLRVGSFQYARALGQQAGDHGLLRRLADVAIARHHPDAARAEAPYVALLDAVAAAQARLVAAWMLVGFVHGVMNTDNMTISGETIDYGPCAFVDAHDPATVFSSIDEGGRYAYGNQPAVASWNLARLAEALLPLLDDDAERAVARANESLAALRRPLRRGVDRRDAPQARPARRSRGRRAAAPGRGARGAHARQPGRPHHVLPLPGPARPRRRRARARRRADLAGFDAWTTRWLALAPDPDAMDRVNPVYVPRNHLVEEALDAATAGDLGPFERLLDVLVAPFDERPGLARFAAPAPAASDYTTYCGT